MASITSLVLPKSTVLKPLLKLPYPNFLSRTDLFLRRQNMVVAMVKAMPEKGGYPGEAKGFFEEMKLAAIEGERKRKILGITFEVWEPSVKGYLWFLVDSKVVYNVLESIVERATFPHYANFRNTGLERSKSLAKDIEWLKSQGYTIPEPSSAAMTYANHLDKLATKDPPAFFSHFYNIYFGHATSGRKFGSKVAARVLDGKELEFYKWDGDLAQLLQDVRDKLNEVAESWTREEKNHCLEEREKSVIYAGEMLH